MPSPNGKLAEIRRTKEYSQGQIIGLAANLAMKGGNRFSRKYGSPLATHLGKETLELTRFKEINDKYEEELRRSGAEGWEESDN